MEIKIFNIVPPNLEKHSYVRSALTSIKIFARGSKKIANISISNSFDNKVGYPTLTFNINEIESSDIVFLFLDAEYYVSEEFEPLIEPLKMAVKKGVAVCPIKVTNFNMYDEIFGAKLLGFPSEYSKDCLTDYTTKDDASVKFSNSCLVPIFRDKVQFKQLIEKHGIKDFLLKFIQKGDSIGFFNHFTKIAYKIGDKSLIEESQRLVDQYENIVSLNIKGEIDNFYEKRNAIWSSCSHLIQFDFPNSFPERTPNKRLENINFKHNGKIY